MDMIKSFFIAFLFALLAILLVYEYDYILLIDRLCLLKYCEDICLNALPQNETNGLVYTNNNDNHEVINIEENKEYYISSNIPIDHEIYKTIKFTSLRVDSCSEKELQINRRYSYGGLEEYIKYIALTYPELVKAFVIGKSLDNRHIYGLRVGTGDLNIVVTAGVHSKEILGPLYVLKYVDDLIKNPSHIPILNKITFNIVPCVNPDGYEVAIFGKDVLSVEEAYVYSLTKKQIMSLKSHPITGIDLNRHLPIYGASCSLKGVPLKDEVKIEPALKGYAGLSLGSMPEVMTTMRWISKIYENNNVVLMVDCHNSGELIYAGKKYAGTCFINNSMQYAKEVQNYNNYKVIASGEILGGDGVGATYSDFFTALALGMKFNIELGIFTPIDISIRGNDYEVVDLKKYPCKKVGIATIEFAPYTTGLLPTIETQITAWKKAKDILYILGKKAVELNQ